MSISIIKQKLNNARLYSNGKHVGTIGIETARLSYLNDLYVCSNICNGCEYHDKKGFKYTWCIYTLSISDCHGIHSEYSHIQGHDERIRAWLYDRLKSQVGDLRITKIVFEDELTLYDLC